MLEAQESLRLLKARPPTAGEGLDVEGDANKSKIMLFRWPPARGPSYLPSAEEAMGMITRARANPTDWLPFPKVAGTATDEKKNGRKKAKTRGSVELNAVSKSLAAAGKWRRSRTSPAGFGDAAALLQDSEESETEEEEEAEQQVDEEPDFVDEELEALGCRPSLMPGGIARPPPSLPD